MMLPDRMMRILPVCEAGRFMLRISLSQYLLCTAVVAIFLCLYLGVKSSLTVESTADKSTLADVSFSADGRIMASAILRWSGDRQPSFSMVKVWETVSGIECSSFSVSGFRTLALSPDAKMLAISGYRTTIRNLFSGGEVVLPTESPYATSVCFSPDGRSVAVAVANKIAIWDVSDRKCKQVRAFQAKERVISSCLFSPDNKLLLTLGLSDRDEAEATLWNLAFEQEYASVNMAVYSVGIGRRAAFSSDGSMLAVQTSDNTIELLCVSGDVSEKLVDIRVPFHRIWSHCISPDGKLLAIAAEIDGEQHQREKPCTVILVEVATGLTIAQLKGHRDVICGLAFGYRGETLTSVGNDGSMLTWNLSSFRPGVYRDLMHP